MFTEVLDHNLTPLQITELFVKDYEAWRAYAWEQEEINSPESQWNIGKSYDNLILKYCGKDKKYQALSYGNDNELWENFEVLDVKEEKNKAVVRVKHTNPQFDFLQNEYEFHFVKESRWILQEKYYLDSYDNNNPLPCL